MLYSYQLEVYEWQLWRNVFRGKHLLKGSLYAVYFFLRPRHTFICQVIELCPDGMTVTENANALQNSRWYMGHRTA
jgi:hypothetical protein